jgi:pimeloyl-ACP methyl ester carboxylesterase
VELHTRQWGHGDRVAVLVHGIMSDSRTWHRVAPALAERGYRVIAVDQRGHGESPRGAYSPQEWAQDLVDTLPAGIELAIGHSLGALTLAAAVERLRPARAVYVDPAWRLDGFADGLGPAVFKQLRQATREQIAEANPRWEAADVDVEVGTIALWDEDTADALGRAGTDHAPAHAVVPSLVLAAEYMAPGVPPLVDAEFEQDLQGRGFEVRRLAGLGHTPFRDDHDAFMAALDGWL